MERNLYRYILRRSLGLQVAMLATITALGVLNPYILVLTKKTINSIREMHLDATLGLLGWFLAAVLATGALKYLRQNLEGVVQETMLRDLRSQLYQRILRFPLPYARNTTAAQLSAMILAETEALGNFFGEAFSVPLYQGFILIGSVGFMLWQNPWMSLVALVLFPIQAWLVRKLQRRVIRLSRERVRLVRTLSDRVQESVAGLQEIQANNTLAYESHTFDGPLGQIFKVRIRIYNLKYLVKWFNNFTEKFGIFLLLLVGGWLIIKRPGSLDLGGLVAFLEAYRQLNEPWRELIGYVQDRDNAKVNYEQVIASFDPPDLRPESWAEDRLPEPAARLEGAYDLRGASVMLDDRKVVDGLQFSTLPKESVAIVGTAGSGKSVLTMVLAKLYGYTGTVLLDQTELVGIPGPLTGRQIAYVGSDVRLFTTTVFENLVYGLRHRPAACGGRESGDDPEAGGWLDLSLAGVSEQAELVAAVLASARVAGLDEDLFGFGLHGRIDPSRQPEIAQRVLEARQLVMDRFAQEQGDGAVEFLDRSRFAAHASIGENILFGHSSDPTLTVERLAGDDHFRDVITAVGLQDGLLALGGLVARETVEIFQGMPTDHELFANFSLIAASELPEYTRLVSRLDREPLAALPAAERERLIALALRVVPARHRMGQVDDAFMAKVVAARQRYTDTLPPGAPPFVPYDRDRYFAQGTLLENLLFGKVIATSSTAVKTTNALVAEVISAHRLRDVVMEAGLSFHVGLAGSRLSPAQRQKVGIARALLKRPQILILDDALGALEPDKRSAVQQRLREEMKGRTLVAVLGQPEQARGFDRVVVLDGGRVAEVGSFQQLMAQDGLFRQLLAQVGAGA